MTDNVKHPAHYADTVPYDTKNILSELHGRNEAQEEDLWHILLKEIL